MQSYIINSFKKISDNSIWIRQETGTNSGGYVRQSTLTTPLNTDIKRLNDFLCDGEFIIHSILRVTSTDRQGRLSGEIFTVAERVVSRGVTLNVNISKFKIEMSNVIIWLVADNNSSHRVLLTEINKYKEPVVTAKQTPVRKGKTIVGKENTAFADIVTAIESKTQPVRLEKTYKKRTETIEEFLVKFFKKWNNENNTIFVDTLEVQTATGKRRSLGDIYMILKYYYPDTTLNEVLNLLYNTLPATFDSGFRASYCHTIKKKVWYYDSEDNNGVFDKTTNDEYGKPYRFYAENIK